MTMTQAYSDPSRETDEYALPDIEVFYANSADKVDDFYSDFDDWTDEEGNLRGMQPGWYWWSCSPGCLPDGDPCGPFESEAAALMDARDHMGSGWHD
jgi:hypothetical protein